MNNDDYDEDEHESEDDALEDTRAGGMFHPNTDEEQLEGDYDSPAAPANDIPGPSIPPDDPRTDSGLDEDELYSEGLGEAIGADEEEVGPDRRARPLEPENGGE